MADRLREHVDDQDPRNDQHHADDCRSVWNLLENQGARDRNQYNPQPGPDGVRDTYGDCLHDVR